MRRIPSPSTFLIARDVSYIDSLLFDDCQRLRCVPDAVIAGIDHQDLMVWCLKNAVYGLVTEELVAWLKELIGDRSAIEVGSGNGSLGRALGITRTDSFIQDRVDVALYYIAMGQPIIAYGHDVEKLEAQEAVDKYKPQVVIGSWLTQWIDPELPPPPAGGSIYGIREEELLRSPSVEAYVVVGNREVHGAKAICRFPYDVYQFPWIRSRSSRPAGNAIFVWCCGEMGE